ncbi:hypothetical protein ACQJBY_036882 [Aegilops geniculata]
MVPRSPSPPPTMRAAAVAHEPQAPPPHQPREPPPSPRTPGTAAPANHASRRRSGNPRCRYRRCLPPPTMPLAAPATTCRRGPRPALQPHHRLSPHLLCQLRYVLFPRLKIILNGDPCPCSTSQLWQAPSSASSPAGSEYAAVQSVKFQQAWPCIKDEHFCIGEVHVLLLKFRGV